MLVIHTADVHIGVENYGRPDPDTRTSSRLKDFLDTLDEVVNYSIKRQADIVLFCGDAYKSRNPTQTHQREFATRVSKLSSAGIQVFLLAGNHDSPNISGPATALDIFPTLHVENVHIGDTLKTHLVQTKSGPLQIVALPWIRKGQFMSLIEFPEPGSLSTDKFNDSIEAKLTTAIGALASSLDPKIPAILAGHVSIDSATTSSEKSMMLGKDYVLLKSSIALSEFDYVALGHIHRYQVLNESPRVVYPGSLQRIDFGEENDTKGFCAIELDPKEPRGAREKSYEFVNVGARKFITIKIIILETDLDPMSKIARSIQYHDVSGAIVQVFIEVPVSKYKDIDETRVREMLSSSHYIATVRRNMIAENRNRLGKSLSENIEPIDALNTYFEERKLPIVKRKLLIERGKQLIEETSRDESVS